MDNRNNRWQRIILARITTSAESDPECDHSNREMQERSLTQR
jgi:hypothetical protein